jgi:hypothetical protein
MATLLVLLIAFALILGKSDLAERGVKALVGTILVLSFLPGVLARQPDAGGCAGGTVGMDKVAGVVLFILLAGVGLLAWRLRPFFAKRREAEARRWAAPRERATPPAPQAAADDEEPRP